MDNLRHDVRRRIERLNEGGVALMSPGTRMPAQPTDSGAPEPNDSETRASGAATPDGASARKRGRPAIMSREQLVIAIGELAKRPEGLFRVHQTDSDLYARARRMFGSWSAAVVLAGADYSSAIVAARRRSVETRRRRRRRS